MELRQIQYFLAVADTGNMTRAAEVLHVSQPALSQALKSLEDTLGQSLFKRSRFGAELTAHGKQFRHHALRIMHAVHDAEDDMGLRTTGQDLRVGVLPTLAHDYIPTVLRQFLIEHDNLSLHLTESHTQGLVRQVLTGELHLAVIDLPVSESALNVAPLWRERLVFVSSPSLVVASLNMSVSDLSPMPFITMEPGYGLRDALYGVTLAQGFQPWVLLELTSLNAVTGFVHAGFGITLLPERSVISDVHEGRLKILPVRPESTRHIGVIWRAGRRLPGAAELFRDRLVRDLPQLARDNTPS